MNESDIQNIIWGTLGAVSFICFLCAMLVGPMVAVFFVVWLVTTNVWAGVVLGGITEAIYLYFWVLGK
jgi:hypothetical protein